MAFIIGSNLHYAYRHSVLHDFLQERENFLYEFVKRTLFDMIPLKDVRGKHYTGLDKSFFYVIETKGVVINSIVDYGPSF